MSVPKHIVALIDAKNEEILRLEREKAESEHALGFAIDRVERLEAEKAEMLAILEEVRESSTCCGTYDLLDETTWASPDLADGIEAAIRKARGGE